MGKRQRRAEKRAGEKFTTILSEMEIFAGERATSFEAHLRSKLKEQDVLLLGLTCREPTRKLNLMWTVQYSVTGREVDAVIKSVSSEFPRGTARYDLNVCDIVADRVVNHARTAFAVPIQ